MGATVDTEVAGNNIWKVWLVGCSEGLEAKGRTKKQAKDLRLSH